MVASEQLYGLLAEHAEKRRCQPERADEPPAGRLAESVGEAEACFLSAWLLELAEEPGQGEGEHYSFYSPKHCAGDGDQGERV